MGLLVERQWLWKENRALATRLYFAQFKIAAALEDIDYRHPRGLKRAQIDQLRAADWIQKHHSCLVTGPTGSGKTYLACALGHQACRDGFRVRYYYAPKLFRELQTAHARRGLHEALGEGRSAAWLVGQIGRLYAVEKQLREQNAGPQLRAAMRAWQSRPILERLRRALEIVRRRVLPKSLLGQAIDYTLARWAALIRYVDDGRLAIDNNACENSIRPTAVGKKIFLFIGHPEAGQRSAVIYSVLGSCRRHGINPAEYLQDVFERLPKAKSSEVPALTPAAWVKAKRAAARQAN